MRRVLLTLLILFSGLPSAGIAGDVRALVLVTARDSALTAVSADQVRKAYLGVPIIVNGQRLQPLQNRSDELLDEVFLQKAVFLSRPAFERQLLSRVFRLGGQKPATYDDAAALLLNLRRTPGAVTYVWASTLAPNPDLRVVATLWTGAVQ